MSTELERLRRRLYVPDAGEADLAQYRRALEVEQDAPSGSPEGEAGPGRDPERRRRSTLIAGLAAGVLALAGAAALAGTIRVPATARVSATSASVGPPIFVRATPAGLAEDVGLQRLVDQAFADQYSEQAVAAADSIRSRIRRALLPDATAGAARASAGGRNDDGSTVVIQPPSGRTSVAAGELLLLSVVTREPAASSWRVLGWRDGEPHRPHPIIEVRSGDADRIAVALLRAPQAMTVTSVRVTVAPRSPFLYGAEQHARAACRQDGCDAVDPAAGG